MHYEIYLHGGIQELTMYMKIYMYYVIYEHEEKCIYYVIDIRENMQAFCDICKWRYMCIMYYIYMRCTRIRKYIYMNI